MTEIGKFIKTIVVFVICHLFVLGVETVNINTAL